MIIDLRRPNDATSMQLPQIENIAIGWLNLGVKGTNGLTPIQGMRWRWYEYTEDTSQCRVSGHPCLSQIIIAFSWHSRCAHIAPSRTAIAIFVASPGSEFGNIYSEWVWSFGSSMDIAAAFWLSDD
jgi:hypothetical protein